jgi:hypothetical protein
LPVGQPAEHPVAEQRPDVTQDARRISAADKPVPLYRPTNVNMHRPGKSVQHSSRKKRKRLAHFQREIATEAPGGNETATQLVVRSAQRLESRLFGRERITRLVCRVH